MQDLIDWLKGAVKLFAYGWAVLLLAVVLFAGIGGLVSAVRSLFKRRATREDPGRPN